MPIGTPALFGHLVDKRGKKCLEYRHAFVLLVACYLSTRLDK